MHTVYPIDDLFPDADVQPISADWARSPAFLKSFVWAMARYKALREVAGKCVVCGQRPGPGNCLNVDHIKPRSTHPELALRPDNLQVMCADCNRGKGSWDATDWREKQAA